MVQYGIWGKGFTTVTVPLATIGDSTGSGTSKVPGGNPRKYLQIKIPIPAGSWYLSTHMDGGDHPSPQIPENSQVPLRNLPNKVIFTCTSVSDTFAGTCWPHPSRMEVTVSRHVTPAGPLCYALSYKVFLHKLNNSPRIKSGFLVD